MTSSLAVKIMTRLARPHRSGGHACDGEEKAREEGNKTKPAGRIPCCACGSMLRGSSCSPGEGIGRGGEHG